MGQRWLLLRARVLGILVWMSRSRPLRGVARDLRRRLGDKQSEELRFQLSWGRLFSRRREVVREYWHKYRYLSELQRCCVLGEEAMVLDVGCGISTVLHFVPGRRFGVDPLGDVYRRIYKYPSGVDVIGAPGECLPFPDNHFDLVFCSNVLDHVEDPVRVLEEIRRVLRESGYFFLTVEVFEDKKQRDPAHPHCFTRARIRGLVGPEWESVFEGESPFVGLRNYAMGDRDAQGRRERVCILRKKTGTVNQAGGSLGST